MDCHIVLLFFGFIAGVIFIIEPLENGICNGVLASGEINQKHG